MTTKNKSRTGRPKKSVTMIEANNMELQVQQNTVDIMLTRKDINDIKDNHLAHISRDINKLDKRIEKIDYRLWSIMILVVGSAVANYLM